MSWTVSCYCGHIFRCVPPAECPRCGVPVTDGRDAHTVDAWIAAMRAEIPKTGTTSWDADHETW